MRAKNAGNSAQTLRHHPTCTLTLVTKTSQIVALRDPDALVSVLNLINYIKTSSTAPMAALWAAIHGLIHSSDMPVLLLLTLPDKAPHVKRQCSSQCTEAGRTVTLDQGCVSPAGRAAASIPTAPQQSGPCKLATLQQQGLLPACIGGKADRAS